MFHVPDKYSLALLNIFSEEFTQIRYMYKFKNTATIVGLMPCQSVPEQKVSDDESLADVSQPCMDRTQARRINTALQYSYTLGFARMPCGQLPPPAQASLMPTRHMDRIKKYAQPPASTVLTQPIA